MKKLAQFVLLFLIVALGAWLRLRGLGVPDSYMFDEVYHVPTATLIARGDPRAYQWWHQELTEEFGGGAYVDWLHPPLAKLVQAVGSRLWGESLGAWRLPSALMGIVLIIITYCLARAVYPRWPVAALLAAGLAAVDGLAVAMSRIVMNDIFVTTFAAIALWSYWRHTRQPGDRIWLVNWCVATGLACASKWSGFLLFGFYLVWEMLRAGLWQTTTGRRAAARLSAVALTSVVIYFLSYAQMFWQGQGLGHFWQLHGQILLYQFGLDATHQYSSLALEWPLGLKPVLLYSGADGLQVWNAPFYPTWYLALGCLVAEIMVIFVEFRTQVTRKKPGETRLVGERLQDFATRHEAALFLMLSYFALWTPWIFSPRIMYFHHYLPALPSLWVLTGGVLVRLISSPIKNAKKLIAS